PPTRTLPRTESGNNAGLPPRVKWLCDGFRWYVRRFVRKNFHAVRLSRASHAIPKTAAGPVLVVMNHPGWWDPMVACVLSCELDTEAQFAAIDAVELKKYPLMDRVGFFGVDPHTVRGAAAFLRTVSGILSEPGRAVWVTAQGEFADARARPLNLRAGVGHVAARMAGGWVLPVAVEYAFWDQRAPEALLRVGEPLAVADHPGIGGKDWTRRIEESLSVTLDGLNADAASRDPGRFTVLLGDGKVGVGGLYDVVRRAAAWLRGRRFDAKHGGGS
ncbi:MAG: lysophospholipid acyltransferase family protein, partial [Fimbriiglobus sp.]